MNILHLAGFFGFVLAAVAGLGYLFLRVRPSESLPGSAAGIPAVAAPGPEPALVQTIAGALYWMGQSMPANKKDAEPLRRRLFRAGYRAPSAVPIFHGLRTSIAALGGFATFWFVGSARDSLAAGLVPALCATGFGLMIPNRVIEWRTRARASRIRVAIPAALDLITLAIEAGSSLDQAMIDTARSLRSIYPDLCDELTFCHLEMRAGQSRYDALSHLAQRSPEEELGKLASLLIDGERFGASLGPALRTHAKYLRQHLRYKAQESARKLTVKLVLPVFFLIFPSVMLVTLGPAYLQMRAFFDDFLK